MPCGRVALIAGSSSITAAAVVSGFAAGVGKIPMKVPGWPLKVTMLSGSAEASSTSATSRRRTTSSPCERIGSAPKASGVCSVDCSLIDRAKYSPSVRPGADRKFEARIAVSTSEAVTLRAASFIGSIQTRIAYSAAPMIWISATPSMVDIRGRITRSRYSVICSADMLGFSAARYMSAKLSPVPFTITGSSASEGSSPRTCWTLASTSVSATSEFAPSFICTETTEAEGRLWLVT